MVQFIMDIEKMAKDMATELNVHLIINTKDNGLTMKDKIQKVSNFGLVKNNLNIKEN